MSDGASAPGLLQEALDAMPQRVAVLDQNGVILFVNEAWADFAREHIHAVGDRESLLGSGYFELLASVPMDNPGYATAQAAMQGVRSVLEGREEGFTLEARAFVPGPVRWFILDAKPRAEGAGVVLVYTDITKQKLVEEKLQLLNEELDERMQDRAKELATVEEELEAFLYSASHDLKAPLRGIAGFSRVLAEDYGSILDATARAHLERIQAGAERINDRIDDLLRLSRVSRSELEIGRVDVSSLARDIVAELERRYPARRVDARVQEGLLAIADAGLLRVLLERLLENSWKFTGERELARIEVGALQRGTRTVLFVRDNGAGFNMEYAHKLFLPFQSLHAPGRFEGDGIGLALVQRIAHKHGGRAWGEGEPDAGACFYFYLGTHHR